MIRNALFMYLIILTKTRYFFYFLALKKSPIAIYFAIELDGFINYFIDLNFSFLLKLKTQNFFTSDDFSIRQQHHSI